MPLTALRKDLETDVRTQRSDPMMKRWTSGFLAAAWLLFTVQAYAADSNTSNILLSDVQRLVRAGDYNQAIATAQDYLQDSPHDADGYNLLGYSLRKLGNFPQAKRAYDRALRLDPGHVGAHEYLGELYVQTGQIDKAKAQLATLEKICGTDCTEYRMLAQSIAAKPDTK
jgi:cytochrome c-type biogenesis protein CcmH/NrfG